MIKDLVSDALQMSAIYARIGISGAFTDDLKRLWLRGSAGIELPSYRTTGRLLDRLNDNPRLAEQGRWLLAQLPRIPVLGSRSGCNYAIHELFLIKEFLYHYGKLQLWTCRETIFDRPLPDLARIFGRLDPEGSASPGFRLGPAFSMNLARLASQRLSLERELVEARQLHLDDSCRKLGIKPLGPEFLVPRSERDLASRLSRSPHFALVSESVANLRFKLADDARGLRILRKLERLDQKRQVEEERVLKRLSIYLDTQIPLLSKAFCELSHQALTFILADFGHKHQGVIPRIGGSSIRISQAVNLPLKLHLEAQGRTYQSIDLEFGPQGNLITGPNMGGKSCALQTLGQLVRLSQLRVPLPCRAARLPVFDNIWLNQDDSSRGSDLSAFGRELVSFNEAINIPGKSLLLLDEFARGTNPAEGEALLCAILKYLRSSGHLVVAATHFSAPALMKELAQFTILGPDLSDVAAEGAQDLAPERRLWLLAQKMDYRLRRVTKGKLPPHSALEIARLLGIPKAILELAGKD